jgi:hypothetical protein
MESMTADRLGLVKGKTTMQEAERLMRAKRITGISKTTYIDKDTPLLNAISGDYQLQAHIFEDNVFKESISLNSGPVLPYSIFLKLVKSPDGVLLLAAYRDPTEMVEDPAFRKMSHPGEPRMVVYHRKAGSFVYSDTASLAPLAKKHGGFTAPFLVGTDIELGIIFIARDKGGSIWENAYLIKGREGKIKFDEISLDTASRCKCVERYIYGASPEAAREEVSEGL